MYTEDQIQIFVLVSSIFLAFFILTTVFFIVRLKLKGMQLKKSKKKLKEYSENLEKMVEERTKQLLKKEKSYKKLYEINKEVLENSSAGIIRLDKDFKIKYENPEMKRILGVPLDKESQYLNIDIRELQSVINTGKASIFNNFLEGQRISVELPFTSNYGKSTYITLEGVPLLENGKYNGAVLLISDITDRKSMLDEIRKKEEAYRSIFDSANDAILILDINTGKILDANKKMLELYGFSDKKSVRNSSLDQISAHTEAYTTKEINKYFKKASQGKPQIFDWHAKDTKGNMFWVEINLKKAVIWDKTSILAIIRDVTERKESQDKIKKALEERESLLQEIHHRVKNNMQVIISLLNLQSEYLKNKQAKDMLKIAQDRVFTMANVHENLYHSKDFTNIDFKDYIKNIVNHLSSFYIQELGKIDIDIKAKDISLNISKAIPIGLIINELVTNSLKYAFPDKRDGKIFIQLKKDKNNYELNVHDDGVGFPKDLDFRDTGNFGLKLVTLFGEKQLGGNLSLERKKGTNFTLKWED